MMYLVKWRDLPYSLATWEHENVDFAELKTFIDYYWVNFTYLLLLNYIHFFFFYIFVYLGVTNIL